MHAPDVLVADVVGELASNERKAELDAIAGIAGGASVYSGSGYGGGFSSHANAFRGALSGLTSGEEMAPGMARAARNTPCAANPWAWLMQRPCISLLQLASCCNATLSPLRNATSVVGWQPQGKAAVHGM